MRNLVAALLLTVSVSGCSKKEEAPPPVPAPKPAGASIEATLGDAPAPPQTPAPTAPTATPEAPPADVPGDKVEDQLPTAPPNSSKTSPIHQPLTATLRNYQVDTGKLPKDFNTLVQANYIDKIPTPPPGKKFALDRLNLQVVIIDR
jgi:hypothetical protein